MSNCLNGRNGIKLFEIDSEVNNFHFFTKSLLPSALRLKSGHSKQYRLLVIADSDNHIVLFSLETVKSSYFCVQNAAHQTIEES